MPTLTHPKIPGSLYVTSDEHAEVLKETGWVPAPDEDPNPRFAKPEPDGADSRPRKGVASK